MTTTPPDQDNASLDAQLNDAVDHHRAAEGVAEQAGAPPLAGTSQPY